MSIHSLCHRLSAILGCLALLAGPGAAQVVSPLQGGHYSPTVANIRDFATPPSGLFVLWYNAYASSSRYIDRNGNEFSSIPLDRLHPGIPAIDVNIDLQAFATIPNVFWASDFTILGGARYIGGLSASYISSDVSLITERGGVIKDTTNTRTLDGRVSGLSDMVFMPVGLSWALGKTDLTFFYGFAAPTGAYETGADDNVGLGFWTHQFQLFGYFYPVEAKSTAIMAGLTYEMNSGMKDADVTPGSRLTLEWGISQYLSEQFELGVQGGHNWQVGDDDGADVWWDPSVHDRKSTVAFSANYWLWKDRLSVAAKYAFDFDCRQRFRNDTWLLNMVFVPNVATGSKTEQ